MGLSSLSRPFIVCVLTDRSVEAALATMGMARLEGAHAFELNLPLLADAAPAELARLFNTLDRPVYTSCRRADFLRVYGVDPRSLPAWDDEQRMARQLACLELGAAALDMELDCFDPHPAPPLGTPEAAHLAATPGPAFELSHEPAALARQAALIAAAHAAGGEVIGSCHSGRPQNADQLLAIAQSAAARGIDLVKIVSPCPQIGDLLELLAATARLQHELPIPTTLVGAGSNGMLSRTIGPTLGAGWVLAQQALSAGGFHDQPLVAQAREILRLIPWRFRPDVS